MPHLKNKMAATEISLMIIELFFGGVGVGGVGVGLHVTKPPFRLRCLTSVCLSANILVFGL